MVCTSVMPLILLFLFSPTFGAEVQNLSPIINFLYRTYRVNQQFALAINVPTDQCADGFKLDQNFLPQDNAKNVRDHIRGADRVYRGEQLIGATTKEISKNKNSNYHSEFLLLIRSMSITLAQYDPLMQWLLNSNPNGCAVFYTLNSPCVRTCSSPNGRYSIIPALSAMFEHRNTPKAFVFRQVWRYDIDVAEWRENIRTINAYVPIYRCDNTGCTHCVNNNNQVNDRCMRN